MFRQSMGIFSLLCLDRVVSFRRSGLATNLPMLQKATRTQHEQKVGAEAVGRWTQARPPGSLQQCYFEERSQNLWIRPSPDEDCSRSLSVSLCTRFLRKYIQAPAPRDFEGPYVIFYDESQHVKRALNKCSLISRSQLHWPPKRVAA